MKKYVAVLKRTQMFAGVGDEEINAMLSCLGARLFTYKKGEYVFRQGEHVQTVCLLAEGKLYIQNDDFCFPFPKWTASLFGLPLHPWA